MAVSTVLSLKCKGSCAPGESQHRLRKLFDQTKSIDELSLLLL